MGASPANYQVNKQSYGTQIAARIYFLVTAIVRGQTGQPWNRQANCFCNRSEVGYKTEREGGEVSQTIKRLVLPTDY